MGMNLHLYNRTKWGEVDRRTLIDWRKPWDFYELVETITEKQLDGPAIQVSKDELGDILSHMEERPYEGSWRGFDPDDIAAVNRFYMRCIRTSRELWIEQC